jgi:hypothetical protein
MSAKSTVRLTTRVSPPQRRPARMNAWARLRRPGVAGYEVDNEGVDVQGPGHG